MGPLQAAACCCCLAHLEPEDHAAEAHCDQAVVVVAPHKHALLQQRKRNCRQAQTGELCDIHAQPTNATVVGMGQQVAQKPSMRVMLNNAKHNLH